MIEFEQHFHTKEACQEYLYRMRWPNGFICNHYGHEKCWNMQKGVYRCGKCKYENSVTTGTIFQGSRIPLRIWFGAIWQVIGQKSGISVLGLPQVLGLTGYETAWTMLHKLRIAMVRPGRDRLNGLVQVDEAYIGGHHSGKRLMSAKIYYL